MINITIKKYIYFIGIKNNLNSINITIKSHSYN